MRIFLTGATGFVGTHLRQALVGAGHQVVALARRALAPAAGIEWVDGEIAEINALVNGMAGCQAVIHLVGIIRERGEATFDRIHVQGTENVLAAMRQAGISRLLHMSALGARPHAVTAYYRSKWLAEEAVSGSGLHYTIFRPSLIFGPGDGFFTLLADQLRRYPVTPIIDHGQYLFAPISIHAVTAAFMQALDQNGATARQAFELCGPEIMTYAQILDTISAQLGIRKLRIPIPPALVALAARILTGIGLYSPITEDELRMLLQGNICHDGTAQTVFELPHITLAEGLSEV